MYTLKNIKYAAFSSHETNCFTATVYRDGKKWGTADNDGRGGCTCLYPIDGNKADNTLENIVDDLLEEWLGIKECRKILRRISYIGKKGGVYSLPSKFKPTSENIEKVKSVAWWKKEYIMLNDMSFDEAVKLIRKAA